MVGGRFPSGRAKGISNDRLTGIPYVGIISNMKAVLLLVETDFMTGETIRVDGGRHLL